MKKIVLTFLLVTALFLTGCTGSVKLTASDYDGLLVYTTVAYSSKSEDYNAYELKGGKLISSADFSGLRLSTDIVKNDDGFPMTDDDNLKKVISETEKYEKDGKYYASHIYICGGRYFFTLIKGDYSETEFYAYDAQKDKSVKLFVLPELEIVSYVGYKTDKSADGYVAEICYFDSSAVESEKESASYAVAQISADDSARLYALFYGKSFVIDAVTDRVAFSFDGKFVIKKGGKFIDVYFGYADKVIYYDYCYAELTDGETAFIKSFDPHTHKNIDDSIYITYTSDFSDINASIPKGY